MAEGTGPGASIGRRLRDMREAGLWTRSELSAKSGVSEGGIEEIEWGSVRRPRRTTIEKLAKAIGVPVETLMYGPPSEADGTEDAAPKAQPPPPETAPRRPGSPIPPVEAGRALSAAEMAGWQERIGHRTASPEVYEILYAVERGETTADEAGPAIMDALLAALKAGEAGAARVQPGAG